MSELPKGWVEASLGDLGSWFGGGTPSKSRTDYWHAGTIPWVSPKDMKRAVIDGAEDSITALAVEQSSTKLVPAGSVLMVVRSGILAHTFPVATFLVPVTINQDMKALLPSELGADFVAHGLRAFESRILDECTKRGTTVASVNTDALYGFAFPIPPVNEQKRIVAKINALTEKSRQAREALDEIPDLLDKLRQSILAAAFRGDLTKEWRKKNPNVEPASVLLERIRAERRRRWEEAELAKMKAKGKSPKDDSWKAKYEEPKPVDTDGLPEVPEGWCWASLDQLTLMSGGITKGQKRAGSEIVARVPYLHVANVQRGALALSEVLEIEATKEEIRSLQLQPGDILLNEGGDIDKVGRGWVWQGQLPFCIHQNHVFRARPVARELEPELISHFTNTFGQNYFLSSGKQTTNLASVSMTRVKACPVPVQSAPETRALLSIVRRALGLIDVLQVTQSRTIGELQATAASILAKAFRGELVPQDPTEEAANILLDRIRSERASASEKKRTTKKKTA